MAAGTGGIAATAGAHELLAEFLSAIAVLDGRLGEEGRGEKGGRKDQHEKRKADSSSRADCAKCKMRDALLGMTASHYRREEGFFDFMAARSRRRPRTNRAAIS